MNQRRIFIAINLGEKEKKYIEKKVGNLLIEDFSKIIRPENYHLTLEFLGYLSDEELGGLCKELELGLKDFSSFDILFDSFDWGPDKERRKMIWLSGKSNPNLVNLRNTICKIVLNKSDSVEFKNFRPHITVARTQQKKIKQIEKMPEIEKENVSLLVPVSSVDVMESCFEEGKRKYYVMEGIELK